jgi:hypothetical protein
MVSIIHAEALTPDPFFGKVPPTPFLFQPNSCSFLADIHPKEVRLTFPIVEPGIMRYMAVL